MASTARAGSASSQVSTQTQTQSSPPLPGIDGLGLPPWLLERISAALGGSNSDAIEALGSADTGEEAPGEGWWPELPEVPDLGSLLPDLPDLGGLLPDLGELLPDLGNFLPDLPDLHLPWWGDDPVLAPGKPPEQPEQPPDEEPLAGTGVDPHLDRYLAALDAAFEDPTLGGFAFAGAASTAASLGDAWRAIGPTATRVSIAAVTLALHQAAAGEAVAQTPESERAAAQKAFAAKGVADRLRDTYVLARVLAPDPYGLTYPTASELGVDAIDLGAALGKGRDPDAPVGAEGEALDIAPTAGRDASAADRAAHLAEVLAATELPAEWIAGAHADIDALYDGTHAAEIAAASLPATAAEAERTLQQKVIFANQRDNAAQREKADGGTCNLTAVGMAMQAAGIVAPTSWRGVRLDGMQYEERLLAIANLEGWTSILAAATWKQIVEACGGQFDTVHGSGEIPWEVWERVQTEHLDKGHGIVLSNNGHVVRLQEVGDAGLTVDDPYGESDVKDTSDHSGSFSRTFTKAGQPQHTVKLSPVWRLGGTYYAAYDSGQGEQPYTTETLDAALLALLAAEVDDASGWVPVADKDKYKATDRPTTDSNGKNRDRSELDGEDAAWEKTPVEGHWMGGIYAVWR